MSDSMPTARIGLIAAASLAVLLGVSSLGLYIGVYRLNSETSVVKVLASALHLPVARVSGAYVPYGDYIRHVQAQRAYFASDVAKSIGINREITDEERVVALDRAIRMMAVDKAADKADLEVTKLDVDRAYDNLASQASTSSEPGDFETVLSDMLGMGPDEFKRLVVKPALQEDALKQRRLAETQDPMAFENELEALMQNSETKRYLTFKLEPLR